MKQRYTVVLRDEFLIIASKPPGLLTIPDRYDPEAPNLMNILRSHGDGVMVVHRLDRETSGLVLFAMSEDSHRNLSNQFMSRTVRKIYHALIEGVPSWTSEICSLPLRTDADRSHRTRVDVAGGKPSETSFRVVEKFDSYALVEAAPVTGRTHQVRVHLAAIGHPIVSDSLYGSGGPLMLSSFKRRYSPGHREEKPLISRVALHAYELDFKHPATGEPVHIAQPYHRDFKAAVNQLRKHGSYLSAEREEYS